MVIVGGGGEVIRGDCTDAIVDLLSESGRC